MSKIKLFGLGGFAENGKNMYVIDVDSHLFILDAGLKYPGQELYGVDEIIPDYKILLRAKNIEGIFISHGHEDHIGALSHILKEINVPVYATHFTMEIIKDMLIDADFDLSTLNLITVNQNSIIKYGNVRVTFFNTTHSIPESIGIAIHTTKGVIVYTSEFTFEQSNDIHYQTDFQKINDLASKKILALMVEAVGASTNHNSDAAYQLKHRLNSIYETAKGRIIVSLFSSDLKKIQSIVNISLLHQKKIAIIGRRAQRIVDIAIKSGYLNIPEASLVSLRFIDEKNKNDAADLVCLVTGSRHEPFYMLQRMSKRNDRLIHINHDDTIILMTSPVPGTEKMAARTLDVLYRTEAKVKLIDKKLLSSSHASSDEIKMMINFLKPTYVIPCIGDYRQLYQVKKLAHEMRYTEEQVFLLDNGDVLNLSNDEPFVSKGDIQTNEIFIDGTAVGDVNDYVIRDRELLAEDGLLLIVSHINPKKKQIIGDIIIESKGFFYEDGEGSLLDQVKEIFKDICKDYLKNKYINWNDLKKDIRNSISKFVYQQTRRSPITIPVIISTE